MIREQTKAAERIDRSRLPAAMATLAIAAILVTPYCGLMFGCGCTWPWSGLVAECSFFQPQARVVCPWCAHTFAGLVSVLLATGAAVIVAAKMSRTLLLPQRSSIVVGTILGAITFLLVATITGWMTATATEYPGFLMSVRALR